MRAAVVKDFTQPLEITEVPTPEPGPGEVLVRDRGQRAVPHRHPRRPRRLAGQAHPAVHPRPRGRRDRRAVGAGVTAAGGRRPGRHAVARATPADAATTASTAGRRCASSRSTPATACDGGFAEYAVANAALRAAGPGRHRPSRRRPADLRRRHDLQGGQGRRRAPGRARRDLRHRRPGSPGAAVRPDRRRRRDRASTSPTEKLAARQGARRRPTSSTPATRPGGGHPGAGRRRRRRRARRRPRRSSSRRHASLRRGGRLVLRRRCPRTTPCGCRSSRPCSRGSRVIGSIVGTRAGPRRGLRAARRGPDPRRAGGASARRRQRGDRGRAGRAGRRPRGPAALKIPQRAGGGIADPAARPFRVTFPCVSTRSRTAGYEPVEENRDDHPDEPADVEAGEAGRPFDRREAPRIRVRVRRGRQGPQGPARRQGRQPGGDDGLGLPVPPGFTITTDGLPRLPRDRRGAGRAGGGDRRRTCGALEERAGRRFGDPAIRCSCRCGRARGSRCPG